ncbi:hypothetical protein [Microbacterium sp. Leaf179]|uniref:hypothetical protein n=1 Tax=Microbacterium sp. Leaf179 TaxID=1736288 RepID=UPI000A557BFC|nr:hypothetical protein [Microbacterium sp. Leaf179]
MAVPAIMAMSATPAYAGSNTMKMTISSAGQSLPASGATPVTVTVTDAQDIPQGGQSVSLLGPSNAVFATPTGTTNGSGVFSTTVDLKTPWMTPGSTVTLTAVSGTSSAAQPFLVLGANMYANVPLSQYDRVFPSPVVSITNTHFAGGNGAAVLADGSVWTFGSQAALMGDGSTSGRNAWGKVPSLSGAAEVVAGTNGGSGLGFFLVRLKNGEVWGWGANGAGQLGNAASQGTVTNVPVKMDGVGDAVGVAAAENASFVVRSAGALWAVGSNNVGTAGLGSDQGIRPLTQVAVGVGVVSVATRRNGGYCVGSDGSLWGWGYGFGSYVGGGNGDSHASPLKLLVDNSGAPLPTNFVSVWAGLARAANFNYAAVFAVTADGAVYGWGENGNGQLGQGDSAPRSNIYRPTLVAGATNVSRIYVSSRSVTALRKDGTVMAWGETELSGIGTTSTPTAVTGLRPITGLTQNAFNAYGQERYFITGSEALTVDVAGATLTAGAASTVTATVTSGGAPESGVPVALSATAGSVLAATSGTTSSAGTVQTTVTPDTWTTPGATVIVSGSTDFGQATDSLTVLGANMYDSFPPAQYARVFPSPVVSITSTYTGGGNNAVVLADGSVWTRGSQPELMGDGSTSGREAWGKVPSLSGAAEVVSGTEGRAGFAFFIVRLKNGEVWGWGNNRSGQLGNAASQGTVTSVPVKMDGVTDAVGVAAAFNSTFVLRSGGALWGVGSNYVGTLGLGTDQGNRTLTQLAVGVGVVSVATRTFGGYCVGSDGSLWGWGYGYGSYVGGGNGDTHWTPLKLLVDNSGAPLPTNFVSVWAGLAKAADGNQVAVFAVTADGAVYGWGWNENGQLGLGDSAPRPNIYRPTLVAGATNVSRIYVSSRSVTALRKDGTVLVWGETELSGIGTTSTPTAVTGLRPITGLTQNAFNAYGQERYFITAP